jgi:antitoxin MazE
MEATLQKWGNSNALRFPKSLLKKANFSDGENVNITALPNRIIIERRPVEHKTIEELFAGSQGYDWEEWDTGSPVGNEVF